MQFQFRSGSAKLLQVIADHFECDGFFWRGHGQQRAGWLLNRQSIRVPQNFYNSFNQSRTVTAHETMEALMTLRDWLRPHVGGAQTAQLLAFARRLP